MRVATFNILHGRSPVDDRVDIDRYAAAVRALEFPGPAVHVFVHGEAHAVKDLRRFATQR